MNKFKKLALAAALCLPLAGRAYITSAVLEYSADDQAGFWINGTPVIERSSFAPFDYSVLSTSDGTLKMEVFNPYGDNLLAAENFDLEGGGMFLSYRLTAYQSDGDPIRIWSVPEQAKMLHLHYAEKDPAGWNQIKFDDSSWTVPTAMTSQKSIYTATAILPDPAFAGFLGTHAAVPYLASTFNGQGIVTRDHNLFRSHFRFPDHPAKVQALVNPPLARAGQNVAVRLIPGPDSTEYSQFDVLAWLPQGMELASLSSGGQFDAKLRRAHWSFGSRDLDLHYARLGVAGVISAPGWGSVEKMLGLEKPGKTRRKLNTPDAVWNDAAEMSPAQAGWFQMQAPNIDLSQGRPSIMGVIFHTQLKSGGFNAQNQTEVDSIRLNYSVDGTTREALKNDMDIARSSYNSYWFDGYYDATEDRKWSWEELSRLRVKLQCVPRGNPDKNLAASIVATVKYYYPAKASPYFFAKVTEPRCAVLPLNTGIFRIGSPMTQGDPVEVRVNAQLCAPTPVPTPTFTPIPKIAMRAPTPEPKHVDTGATMAADIRLHLGCIGANPEPFNYAGTFVSFCLKKDADITLNVYGAQDGKLRRQMKAGSFRPGDSQFFFNAMNDEGGLLAPGDYVFELVAEKEGHKEQRNAIFHMAKKK